MPIISAFDRGEFQVALEEIERYLSQSQKVMVVEDELTHQLKFNLRVLEIRLESLTDEKAELERQLVIFNRRYDEALGEIIKDVLQAKVLLKRAQTERETDPDLAAECGLDAKKAFDDFKEYSEHHYQIQALEIIPELDEKELKTLKVNFKKACSLCHPDKVADKHKQLAHEMFICLKEAYSRNDFKRVLDIYDTLKSGDAFLTNSSTLTETDQLRASISELEHAIGTIVNQTNLLKEGEPFQLMTQAGGDENRWGVFFETQKAVYQQFLSELQNQLYGLESEQ